MLSVVDLFAGVGGLSEGFAKARTDGKPIYELRLLVDKDPEAALTYRTNRPGIPYIVEDISNVAQKDILSKTKLRKGDLDVLIGGPPCQGFSVLRRNRALDDPRNEMMRVFLRFVRELRPRSFMIENVPNLLVAAGGKFWREIRDFVSENYIVKAAILNACDYGVPQWRKRTFIVGFRKDLGVDDFSFPFVEETRKISPKQLMPHRGDEELLPIIRPWISTEEAIGDLPSLRPGREASFYTQEPFTDYQAARRKDSRILANHIARRHDEEFLLKLSKIEEGGSNQELDGRKRFDRGREIKYLSQAYGRLHREGIAQTITAHFLNPGSGRFTHYRDLRSITVREGARFQSFDDDFVFYGNMVSQQRLVGNAVPPLMARALAEYFGKMLVTVQS
jgi:DNA (cytosine-5)-methyltransferase 1